MTHPVKSSSSCVPRLFWLLQDLVDVGALLQPIFNIWLGIGKNLKILVDLYTGKHIFGTGLQASPGVAL